MPKLEHSSNFLQNALEKGRELLDQVPNNWRGGFAAALLGVFSYPGQGCTPPGETKVASVKISNHEGDDRDTYTFHFFQDGEKTVRIKDLPEATLNLFLPERFDVDEGWISPVPVRMCEGEDCDDFGYDGYKVSYAGDGQEGGEITPRVDVSPELWCGYYENHGNDWVSGIIDSANVYLAYWGDGSCLSYEEECIKPANCDPNYLEELRGEILSEAL